MSLKIPVVDRVSAYPGRVKLTPVTGETNTYTMERADSPITEGTLINKALFDNKAYTVTSDTTLYVSTVGDDANGDGSSTAPFQTIQKAIDSVPKHLGGHTVTIEIEAGTYEERLDVRGFSSGKLILGVYGRSTTIRGIAIKYSSTIVTNISYITHADGFSGNLFDVDDNSSVLINQGITFDGTNGGLISCLYARNNSVVSASSGNSITVNNSFAAIDASNGARISLSRLYGSGNYLGISANTGAVISYESSTLASSEGDVASSGGRILYGSGSFNLSAATVE